MLKFRFRALSGAFIDQSTAIMYTDYDWLHTKFHWNRFTGSRNEVLHVLIVPGSVELLKLSKSICC